MMQRFAQSILLLLATFAAGSLFAQAIDYDPRRATELRACDEHQHHGRVAQARTCYSQFTTSSNPITQAEAFWAMGELQRANECFRDIVQANARAVQPRIRWARLFLQTHQYNDAAELFRDALRIFPNDPHAKIGLARVLAERFEGEAGPLLEEVLREHDDLVEAHLLSAQLALESGQVEAAQKALERAGDLAGKQKLPPLEIFAMRAAAEVTRDRDPA
jgi:cellulose synthase operon protein C